jgi:hypothetical protein
MQPPVIRVGNNIYVLAETPLDNYKMMLNEVTKHVYLLASEAMDALDKAKLGPANVLLKQQNLSQPPKPLDDEDRDALKAFIKFWESAAEAIGPSIGEFEEVPFEEGMGRDLTLEQHEDTEDMAEWLDDREFSERISSSLGSQLLGAYSYALGKLDSAVDALGKLLPLMHKWDEIAKQTVSQDPSKAEELSDVLEKMMNLRDFGSKLADLVMKADYLALSPQQQTHATASAKPKYKLVRFRRYIKVGGRVYKMDIEKTREKLIKEGAKAPPLPSSKKSDSPSHSQEADKKRLKSLGGDFDSCVENSKWATDPEAYCARMIDRAEDTTYWRGKGKKRPHKVEKSSSTSPDKIQFKGRLYVRDPE